MRGSHRCYGDQRLRSSRGTDSSESRGRNGWECNNRSSHRMRGSHRCHGGLGVKIIAVLSGSRSFAGWHGFSACIARPYHGVSASEIAMSLHFGRSSCSMQHAPARCNLEATTTLHPSSTAAHDRPQQASSCLNKPRLPRMEKRIQ